MMHRRGDDRFRRPRGGLLLETLLALAILIMVGLLALGVAKDATTATERSDRRAAAVELAASRIAEIEAGLLDLDAVDASYSRYYSSCLSAAGPPSPTGGPSRMNNASTPGPAECWPTRT